MHTSVAVLLALAAFGAAAITYVYAFRGQERFVSFNEYLRKGWPVFTPLNCLLYLATEKRASPAIMDLSQFPELNELQENWTTIRDEGLKLLEQDYFNKINNPSTAAHYDVGFRTFYKYGWRKFYLKWYGYNHHSAMKHCPETVKILSRVPSINGAMFSILPPNSQLTRHLDPVACSLRYHLGLKTPNADQCFINVDGQHYSWRDGDALLFDETFIHYARNDTDSHRLILMCDVDRPMNGLGRAFNGLYKRFMSGTIVPNTDEDKSGWISATFRRISPIMTAGQGLKKTNRRLYKCLKHTINASLVALLVFGLIGVIRLAEALM